MIAVDFDNFPAGALCDLAKFTFLIVGGLPISRNARVNSHSSHTLHSLQRMDILSKNSFQNQLDSEQSRAGNPALILLGFQAGSPEVFGTLRLRLDSSDPIEVLAIACCIEQCRTVAVPRLHRLVFTLSRKVKNLSIIDSNLHKVLSIAAAGPPHSFIRMMLYKNIQPYEYNFCRRA